MSNSDSLHLHQSLNLDWVTLLSEAKETKLHCLKVRRKSQIFRNCCFTWTRLAAGVWMEKITFWQFGPGQNLNLGWDTIIQSNKTFSRRLFKAVEISGLIAFSKRLMLPELHGPYSLRTIKNVPKVLRTSKDKFATAIHATNIESLLQSIYCMVLPALETVLVTTSGTQKIVKIIHSAD